jgi:hypothetical protein
MSEGGQLPSVESPLRENGRESHRVRQVAQSGFLQNQGSMSFDLFPDGVDDLDLLLRKCPG